MLKTLLKTAAHLFYPHLCIGCGSDLLPDHELLCLRCINDLPHTEFEKYPNNPIERIFIGRLPIVAATSGFYFSKGELVQNLIHDLKYKGNKDAGIYLSEMMGNSMVSTDRFKNIDYLIPLPLFAEKEYKRGFNQADIVCNGLSNTMNIPVLTKNVVRIRFTETQTKKHRTERWDNVFDSFKVTDKSILENKHILLVDDVITTGATLDACAQVINQIKGIKISIATLATASK
ncbi:MAG: ComF family protein [Ferruginibacter sp.]